jgi:hypothetical protein
MNFMKAILLYFSLLGAGLLFADSLSKIQAEDHTSGAMLLPTNASPAAVSNFIATTSMADLHKTYELGLIDKGLVIQAGLMAENKQPLDFYGKVVDQNGNPVTGAKVQGNVGLNVSFVESRDEIHFTETDSEGRFKFLGLHGMGLGIWPQKQGYDYNLKLPSRRPADYHLDPNNPVVFTMWKLKGPEPMKHAEFRTRILCDGATAVFDLTNGKRNPNGNLRITLLRNPLKVRRGKDHFDWSFKIEILGGGLLSESDSYPNWAPENGYRSAFVKTVNATDSPWQARFIQNFYFKDGGGNYGRLFIDVTTDSDTADTGIRIESWVNPSGSQNLEFDTAKQIQ